MSGLYALAYRVLQLVVPLGHCERSKELEIVVLCHGLSILRRRGKRSRFSAGDWLLLAALSRALPCASAWSEGPPMLHSHSS